MVKHPTISGGTLILILVCFFMSFVSNNCTSIPSKLKFAIWILTIYVFFVSFLLSINWIFNPMNHKHVKDMEESVVYEIQVLNWMRTPRVRVLVREQLVPCGVRLMSQIKAWYLNYIKKRLVFWVKGRGWSPFSTEFQNVTTGKQGFLSYQQEALKL